MELSGSHTYAAPIDAVLAMLADPEAAKAKYESMGHRDVEIIDCTPHRRHAARRVVPGGRRRPAGSPRRS